MRFLDLTAQYKTIKKEIDDAIQRVLDSSIFIAGRETEKLEQELAKFCGTRHAVSLNSGTDALFLSLKALGVRDDDEVITTPFTFISTAEVIANLGAKPVFVDIDNRTFNIDPSKIEKKITKKTKAIIPVHLFGQMAEMDEIMRIAKKYKLYVIEDAAQAIGASLKFPISLDAHRRTPQRVAFQFPKKNPKSKLKTTWKMVGSIGDCGCLSFFPTKNLGAYGDGGMVVTNNQKLAEKIKLLKNHGSSPKEKYLNLILGTNSRLDAIQAAILRVKLKYLNKWNRQRAKVAKYYDKKLKGIGDIIAPIIAPNRTHIFHQYTIRTKYRDQIKKFLKEKDIPTMIYYSLPLHLQPVFKYLNHRKGDFLEAEKAVKEVLSLPIYPELKKKEQCFVIRKIKEFYEKEN